MDATITYDEVATLVGVKIPMLEPRPNFERTCMLRRHLERALQRLPCPQRVQHGWKGMVMDRELCSLLTSTPFRLPTSPGAAGVYVRAVVMGQLVKNSIQLPQALFSFDAEHRTRVFYGPQRKHQRRL
jgi:hypothetical protein